MNRIAESGIITWIWETCPICEKVFLKQRHEKKTTCCRSHGAIFHRARLKNNPEAEAKFRKRLAKSVSKSWEPRLTEPSRKRQYINGADYVEDKFDILLNKNLKRIFNVG